jgi:hypothetical protein
MLCDGPSPVVSSTVLMSDLTSQPNFHGDDGGGRSLASARMTLRGRHGEVAESCVKRVPGLVWRCAAG